MRVIARLVVVVGLLLTVSRGAGAAEPAKAVEAGPPSPGGEVALEAASAPDLDAKGGVNLVAQARLQIAGKVALAAAFACIIAGVVMIEIDPYALEIGDWGFAMVGAGVGGIVASSFVLGLTHPVHIDDHPLERERRRNRNADGSAVALTVGYRRTF
jgi:hypothetical protein